MIPAPLSSHPTPDRTLRSALLQSVTSVSQHDNEFLPILVVSVLFVAGALTCWYRSKEGSAQAVASALAMVVGVVLTFICIQLYNGVVGGCPAAEADPHDHCHARALHAGGSIMLSGSRCGW